VIGWFTGDGVVGKMLNILYDEEQVSVKDLIERNSIEKFNENLDSALNNGGYEHSQNSIKIKMQLWYIRQDMVTLNPRVYEII